MIEVLALAALTVAIASSASAAWHLLAPPPTGLNLRRVGEEAATALAALAALWLLLPSLELRCPVCALARVLGGTYP